MNRVPREIADVEDVARAQVIEEPTVASEYVFAAAHDFLDGVDAVDWHLLRHIKQLTAHLEVADRRAWEWNDALLRGFAVCRELRAHGGGLVRGNFLSGSIEFVRPTCR